MSAVICYTPVEGVDAYTVSPPLDLQSVILFFVALNENGDKWQLFDCFCSDCSSLFAGFVGQSIIILQADAIIGPHYPKLI